MPELPEVELVARSLDRLVSQKKIIEAELLREKLAPTNSPDDFAARLGNSSIVNVGRRGKHILVNLDNEQILIVHLRMTGRFMFFTYERDLPKHAHAVFRFSDRSKLVFQDQRHFAMMKIVAASEIGETKELKCLAPEPLSDDFTSRYLQKSLSNSKRSVKEFLLDQTKVCGLGNIYAAEALFLAEINPQTPAQEISPKRAKNLHAAIRFVLNESISHGSTMNVDPENIDGSYYGGDYEGHWRVYARENAACADCETPISRIVQGSRSTFFCPRCQRK